LTILVIDNLSPFTPDILDCLNRLGSIYICKRFSEIGNSDGNIENSHYDKAILSGRPKNCREINIINSKIIKYYFENDIPILGICYGAEIIALTLGGSISRMNCSIQGAIPVTVSRPNRLIHDRKSVTVYESHRYCVSRLPADFSSLASSQYCKHEIFSHRRKKIFGVQFHPEKSGEAGILLLSNFLKL
jgi:GMP synthase (glutamine-hydrolysing)